MDTFHLGPVNENLAEGARLRQAIEQLGIELEGKRRPGLTVFGSLEVIGPYRGIDGVDIAAENPVVIQARNPGQGFFQCRMMACQLPGPRLLGEGWIEAVVEQPEDPGGDRRISGERVGDQGLRIDNAGLPQIAGIGPQHRCFPCRQFRQQDETVEGVVVRPSSEGGQKGLLKPPGVPFESEGGLVAQLKFHVVQDHGVQVVVGTDVDVECLLADDAEAEILQKRHAARQGQMFGLVEDLQPQRRLVVARAGVEGDPDRVARGAGCEMAKIRTRLFRREGFLEGLVDRETHSLFAQRREALLPGRGDQPDRLLEFCLGNPRRATATATDDDVDARHAAFRESRIIGRDMPVIDAREMVAHLLAHQRVVVFARDIDDDRNETVEVIDAGQDPDPRPLAQLHDLLAETHQCRHVDLEEIIPGIGFQRVVEHSTGMAVRVEVEVFLDTLRLGLQ